MRYRILLKIEAVHKKITTILLYEVLYVFIDVRINNIKYAMIGQLQNPCPGFEDVIKAHFFIKRERILQVILSCVCV